MTSITLRPKPPVLTAARLLVVLGALALAAALFGVLPIRGQTPTVLVKNTGRDLSAGSSLTSTFPRSAQSFTTGTNTLGYTLTSIGMIFRTILDTSTAGSELTVTLNEMVTVTVEGVAEDLPGNTLCTLTDPASFSASGLHTFNAPTTGSGACPTLSANTQYFVVIQRANNTTDDIVLESTAEGNEDTGGATGWSIEDGSYNYRSGRTDPWTFSSSPKVIEVRGAEIVHGVTISESALTIAEGGSDTYTIVLDTQPTADVTIIMVAVELGYSVRIPSETTFTPSNWNTPKTVTVRTNQDDDAVDESVFIRHIVAQGSAAEYHALSIDDVDVTVVDDDEAGVTISKDRLTIDEGGSGTYTIVLDTQPSADVTIIISELVLGVAVNPFHPMFTPSNWNTPQTITVGGIQDDDAVDDSVKITHTVAQGSAAEYLGLSIDDIDVTVVDDDVPPKVTIKKRVASAPTSAPFRVTITFDRAVTGFEEGEVTGWYPGTHFSFDLTDLRGGDVRPGVLSTGRPHPGHPGRQVEGHRRVRCGAKCSRRCGQHSWPAQHKGRRARPGA